jgi:CRP-like cAMP-binding protein
LVKQDEPLTPENDMLYFIAKGRCQVWVNDKFQDRWEDKMVRILNPGDHFGEISMLYACNRSATVIALNYCTCARLNRQSYIELVQQYQGLNETMREYVQMYSDPVKIFLEISLNQIDFFKDLPKHVKNEWIFNMKKMTFD